MWSWEQPGLWRWHSYRRALPIRKVVIVTVSKRQNGGRETVISKVFELLSLFYFFPLPIFSLFLKKIITSLLLCYGESLIFHNRLATSFPLFSTPSFALFLSSSQDEVWFWMERLCNFRGSHSTISQISCLLLLYTSWEPHCLSLVLWEICKGGEESNSCEFVASGFMSGPFIPFLCLRSNSCIENPDGNPNHLHVYHIPLHAWWNWEDEIVLSPQGSWIQLTQGQMRSVDTLF